MILEHAAALPGGDNTDAIELTASPDYLGEDSELLGITEAALTESANLTIAMARFEHKVIVENASMSADERAPLMEGAVGEFLKKAAATIKAWWNKFVAWLGSKWTALKDFFVKRGDWLARNKAAITGKSDAELKGMKVSIGKELLSTDFAGMVSASIEDSRFVIEMAKKASASDKASLLEQAKARLMKPFKAYKDGKAIAKTIHDSAIGESEEVELTSGIVRGLLKVAETTAKAADQLKGAKLVAQAALQNAEGIERMENGDRESLNARIGLLQAAGPMIQQIFAAHASVLGSANGQAMSGLVKAAGAKAAKKEEGAAPAAKQEDGDLLGQYMPA